MFKTHKTIQSIACKQIYVIEVQKQEHIIYLRMVLAPGQSRNGIWEGCKREKHYLFCI